MRWCRRNGCGTADVNGHLQWMDGRNLGLHAFRTESQRVALAAACYRRQHGCYPPTLDALVPAFLVDVPRDPFDASKPLGYNAEQGTLHTVGVEGAFNGKIRDPRALRRAHETRLSVHFSSGWTPNGYSAEARRTFPQVRWASSRISCTSAWPTRACGRGAGDDTQDVEKGVNSSWSGD